MIEILNLENIIPLELVYALDEDAVKAVMRNVVDGARAYWIKLASQTFHTTKTSYIQGIQEINWISDDTAVISLVGMLPNILEQGMAQTDMHDTLLGPNVPISALGQKGKHPRKDGGFYRAVPFRHRTPGAGSYGTPMGGAFASTLGVDGAKALGKDIYKAAKKLEPTITDPYTGNTKWGERLDTSQIKSTGKKVWRIVPKLKSYHAADPYSGMIRSEKTYDVATQTGGYTTFRTISSDANGAGLGSSPWIRPATSGKFLAKQVADYVSTRLAPQAFEAYVSNLR